MKISHNSAMGLEVSKGSWEGSQWTITGYPKTSFTVRPFDSAYDFEDFIKEKVKCKGIEFDSESCQFFAYAKTEKRALKFLKDIEEYFNRLRAMAGINLGEEFTIKKVG